MFFGGQTKKWLNDYGVSQIHFVLILGEMSSKVRGIVPKKKLA